MNEKFFQGKIAIVTGGTRGIGKAIATELLIAGSKVAVTYNRDEKSAEESRRSWEAAGFSNERFLVVKSDVSARNNVRELLNTLKKKWNKCPNFLVNNAGIIKQGNFFELSEDQWDQTLAVNLKGPFLLCQESMPLMKETESPAIVNIASVGGQTGGSRAPDYAASKAALICFTQSMARIGADLGIRVNAVSPGWILTGILGAETVEKLKQEAASKVILKRMGEPQEVADAVLFLLSDKSSYITGHVLNVNGGMHF
ncbi:MAG: SDR family NAD(P)-dependent oxidoreductase [Candidatus Omnitrophota bacterium]